MTRRDGKPVGWVLGSSYGGVLSVTELEDQVFETEDEARAALLHYRDDIGYSGVMLLALISVPVVPE